MRVFLIVSILAGFAEVAAAQGNQPPPLNMPFDAAYMVAGPGETTPLTSFSLDGAPPSLLVDMPAGTSWDYWFSGASSTWRSPSGASFRMDYYTSASDDKLWFTPPAATWAASKALGNWSVTAVHSQVELVFIYGVGAPIVWGRGTAIVPFSVVAPMPGDFNHSGAVNQADYSVWQEAFDTTAMGDGNGDQLTNAADFTVWRDAMGTAGAAITNSAAVPEPTALLVLLALLPLIPRIRRSRC